MSERRKYLIVSTVLLSLLSGGMGYAAVGNGFGILQNSGSNPLDHGDSSRRQMEAFAPSIQTLAITDEGVLYAGSFGMGVFRSEDRGSSWHMVNTGLTDPFLLCLEVDHKGWVYAGTVRGGVFRTKNGGTKWESINKGLKRVEVKSLLASLKGIFAGTGRGIYEWKESEGQWVILSTELDQLLVPSLVMLDAHTLLAATSGQGLFGYDLQGSEPVNWNRPSSDLIDPKERLPHRYIRVVAVGPNQHIFLGTQDGGIFRSTDRGISWHTLSRTLPNDSIRSIVAHDTGLFVATGRGVFKLGEDDQRWSGVNTGLTELAIQTLVVSDRGVFFAGTSAGAFRSDNAGDQWVNVSEGLGMYTSQPAPY